MRIFNGFDEIKSAVGAEVGVSDWIEVTQDRAGLPMRPVMSNGSMSIRSAPSASFPAAPRSRTACFHWA